MLKGLNAYSFILVALNLVILYVVLKKILFKPVTEFMEKRTQSIEDSIAEAEKQRAEANELKLSFEKQMSEAKQKGEAIIAEAASRANLASDEIIEKAKQDADFMLQKARQEIEYEREQMLKSVRNQVVDLTIDAASKVLESELKVSDHISLIEKFLNEEGAA